MSGFGSRLRLASGTDQPTIAAWTDTRLGTESTGRQDIVAAQVEVTRKRWGFMALLATGGLLAIALIAFVGWRRATALHRRASTGTTS